MDAQISLQTGVGVVYGAHQFDASLAQGFVDWLGSIDHRYARYFSFPAGSCEFSIIWLELVEQEASEFLGLQDKYHGLLS